MSDDQSRGLLIGALAVHLKFVTEEHLAASLADWTDDPTRPLEVVLRDRGLIDPEATKLLAELADKQIEFHEATLEQAFRTQFDASKTSIDPWLTNLQSASTSAKPDPAISVDLARHSARYHKLKDHAKGGLGQVFVALDEELNRKVALKQIQERFSSDSGARQRFLLEAEVTGGLEHPGIVPVYGLGIYKDGQPYYAMRFIHGESLEQAIRQFHKRHPVGATQAPIDTTRTLELRKLLARLIAVCQAIAYAHSRGVLHRDLKPDNIMLGQYGETLVVDWGLAKVSGKEDIAALPNNEPLLTSAVGTDSNPTRIGSVIGTPAFMSPEQADGRIEAIDPRSDVYSLGATLYCVLVGRPPFQGRDAEGKPISIARLLDQVRTGEFESPRQIDPSLPKPLAAICDKAMATSAEHRYASPLELAEELERWLADEPVVAYRESPIERIKRWAKRHQTVTATAASVVLVSVIGLSLFAAILGQKNAALVIAEAEASEKAAIANAVTQFLNDDLLSQASPAERPDPQLQVQTVFKQATRSLQNRFNDQPLVKAKLLHTIGVASGYLAQLKESEAALTQAAQLRSQHLGPEHPDTLLSQAALGESYGISGKYKESEELLRKTLEQQLKVLGPNHEDVFATTNNLAGLCGMFGQFDEANRLIDQVIAGYTNLNGPNDRKTIESLITKTLLHSEQGDIEKSLALGLELRERCAITLSDIDLISFDVELAIAQQYLMLERYNEAETTYQTTLKRLIESLGESHPYVATIRNDLALMQSDRGDPSQALASLQELAILSETRFGLHHRDTIIAHLNTGRALIFLGRYTEAEAIFKSFLQSAIDNLGPDSPVTQQTRTFMATLEIELDHLETAESILKEVVGPSAQSVAILPTSQLEAKTLLATVYISQQRYDMAESILQSARQQYQKAGLHRTYSAINANSLLIDALVESDQVDRAEALVQEIENQYGAQDALTNRYWLRIAENLFEREMDERAKEDLQRVTQSMTAKPDWQREDFETVYYLTSLLSSEDLDAEAIPLFERLLSSQTQSLGVDHVDRLLTMHGLAVSLSFLERNEEAARLYAEVVERRSKVYGPDAQQTLRSLENWAEEQVTLGDDKGAIESFTRLAAAKKSQGVEVSELVDIHYSLAEALRRTGDLPIAIQYYRLTLEGEIATLGEDAADTLLTMHQLAYCLDENDEDEEAMTVYERVVAGRTKALGPSHPFTMLSLGNLTRLKAELGNAQSAEESINEMRRRLEPLENHDADTINANYVIAEAYRELDRHEEALEFYRKVMEGRRTLLGHDHEDALLAAHQVAFTSSRVGKLEEAIELYAEVVKGRTKTLGPTHPYTLLSLTNAALIQFELRKYDQAAVLLQDKLDRIAKENGPRHADTMTPRFELGCAKYLANDFPVAIDLMSQTVDILRKTLPRDPPPAMQQTLSAILVTLADAEIHDGQVLAAQRHAREGLETLEALKLPSPYIFRAMSILGAVHTSNGEFDQAEKQLQLAYEGQLLPTDEFKPPMRLRLRGDTVDRFLELYKLSKDDDKLAHWQEIRDSLE